MVRIKRVYEPASRADGVRILVDRVWPRGISKQGANVEKWMREIGPSDQLRKWFGHDPERWAEFRKCYREELKRAEARAMLKELAEIAKGGTLTLVYSAKDEHHNQAEVIRELLDKSR